MHRVVIVGAGIGGLATALLLSAGPAPAREHVLELIAQAGVPTVE